MATGGTAPLNEVASHWVSSAGVIPAVTDAPKRICQAAETAPGRAGVPAAALYVRAELLAPDARAQRTTACDPVIGSQTTICRDDLAMESLSSPLFIR